MARMSAVRVARLVVLSAVSFLSAIVLAICVYSLAHHEVDAFDRVNVAVAVLTIVTLPAMAIADLCRHCGVLSYLLTEILYLGSLCVLWLVAAALPTSQSAATVLNCSNSKLSCHKTHISKILGSLSFITLVIYTLTIFIKVVLVRRSPAPHRPARIWTGTVRDVFDPAHAHLTSAMSSPMANDTFMIEHDADPFHKEPVSASIRLSTVVNIDREVRCVEEYVRAPPVAYGTRLFV